MNAEGSSMWTRITLIYALGVFAVAVISIAVPEIGGIGRELHPDSPATLGWVISIPALVAALGSLAVGALVDRAGDRRILIIGSLVVATGDLGVTMAHSLSTLLWWRVVSGVGYACIAVAAVTLLTRVTQGRERTVALALWSTVIPASFIIAFLGGSLLLSPDRWRTAFAWHGSIILVLLGLVFILLPARAARDRTASRTAGANLVLRSPWPYILGASFAANALLQTGVVAGLPQMLDRSIGATEVQVNSFNILAMLMNIAGAMGVGAALNRGVSALAVGSSGVLICGFACLGLALSPISLAPAMTMNCVFMFGCGMLVGLWAILPRVAPSLHALGATSGLITQITLVGVLFGPPTALYSISLGTPGFLGFAACALLLSLLGLPVWLKQTSVLDGTAQGAAALGAH